MEYVLTALVPILAVAVIAVVAWRIAAHDFRCAHCGGEFRIKWWRVLVTRHRGDAYMLECPHCKTKDWCTELPEIGRR